MNKYRIRKLHKVILQLMLISAYPAVFHAVAFLGNANMYKPDSMAEMAFPIATFAVFGVLLLATAVTFIIMKLAEKRARKMNAAENWEDTDSEDSEGTRSNKISLDEDGEYSEDGYDEDEEESGWDNSQRKKSQSEKPAENLVAHTTSKLIAENSEEKFREVVKAHETEAEKKKRKRKAIRRKVPLLLLLGISIALRLPMIGTFQRWDAGEYFYTVGTSVQDYTFTLPDFLYNFSVAYHLNYGFTSFIAIPLFISARSVEAITIWQIAFSILAVLALYKIFRIDFGFRRSKSAVGALIVGNVPIFLGLSAYCTPDYYVVLFFIFALYFEAKKLHILEAFMILMMCFTKENSALIVFGYYGVKLLYRFIIAGKLVGQRNAVVKKSSKEKNEDESITRVTFMERLKIVACSKDFWVAITIGAMFVAAMGVMGANWADKLNSTTIAPDGIAPTGLTLEKPYVYFKLKQFFGSNFAWLISLYFLHAFKTIFIEKKWKNLRHKGWMTYCGLMGAMFCFLVFGLVYHIAAIERYNIFFAVALAFICAAILGTDLNSKWSYAILGGVLAILLGIESFITIDPMTKWLFQQVSIGNDKTMNFESEFTEYFGDGLVTNYQYAWLDKSFDKFLDDIDYDTDKAIYFPDEESGMKSGVHFEGNGGYFRIGWFPEEKKRDYYDYNMTDWEELYLCRIVSDNTWFPYVYVPYTRNVTTEYMKEQSYVCFIPYYEELGVNEEYYKNVLSEYYYIGGEKQAEAYRGAIKYYPMLKKDIYTGGLSMDMVVDEIRAGQRGLDDQESKPVTKTEVNEAAERLANLKKTEYLVVAEMNEIDRTKIQAMDSIILSVQMFDSDGKKIELEHEDEDMVVSVGTGTLVDEVDKALQSMECGEVADVEFKVPEGYPELEEYAGKSVIAKICPQEIVCSLEYSIEQEDIEAVEAYARDEANEYYDKLKARQWVRGYISRNGVDNLTGMVSDEEIEEVRVYYYEYLEGINKTREEFQDWIGATPEEYDQALAVIAAYAKWSGK